VTKVVVSLSASYGYQPFNKLTSTASASYSYDNNGDLTSKTDSLGTWTLTYDEENRLTQVAIPSGPTVSYKYDALGRRIQRISSAGSNERYVYDGADVIIDLNADQQMEVFWEKVLGGSIVGGAIVVGGPPAAAAILRLLGAGGGAILFEKFQTAH
jgi:YD repeat-containing protein